MSESFKPTLFKIDTTPPTSKGSLNDDRLKDENILPELARAVNVMKKIDDLYDESNLDSKKLIVNTIFPQKLTYNGAIDRTVISNGFYEFILLKNRELKDKKKDKNLIKSLCPLRGQQRFR